MAQRDDCTLSGRPRHKLLSWPRMGTDMTGWEDVAQSLHPDHWAEECPATIKESQSREKKAATTARTDNAIDSDNREEQSIAT